MLGLPKSIVVAVSLRDFVNTRSITISYSPKLKPKVEAGLLAMLTKSRIGNSDVFSPTFENLEASFEWLNAK